MSGRASGASAGVPPSDPSPDADLAGVDAAAVSVASSVPLGVQDPEASAIVPGAPGTPSTTGAIMALEADRPRRHTMAFSVGYFILCHVGGPLVHFAAVPEIPYWRDPVAILAHALGMVALATYFLARLGHAVLAARSLVMGAFIIVWTAVGATLGTAYSAWIPFYLAIPPLIGGFIVDWYEVTLHGVANVVGALVLGAAGLLLLPTAVNVAVLAAAVTLVMAISSIVRHQDQATIRDQAAELEARHDDLAQVMVASPDGLVSVDPAGCIHVHNDAAQAFLAAPARTGAVLRDLLLPELQPAFDAAVEDARWRPSPGEPGFRGVSDLAADTSQGASPGDRAALALEVRLPDGREVRMDATRLLTGGYLVTLRDVTAAKERVREEQQRYQQKLEIDKLREMNAFKTSLLNTASHELNTPLTPIRLQLELLRSAERGPLTRRQLHSLDILERNTRRLSNLVQDILDVARMESDRIQIQMDPVAIGNLARDQAEDVVDAAAVEGIDLAVDVDDGLWVEGDPRRLAQAIHQLISNGIRFTPRDGHVTVGCRREGNDVRFWVEDDGIGIPPSRRNQLFQPFSQVHGPDQTRGGTGLGLYIAKGIVEAHGGAIGVQSEGEGKGTLAWFTIPLMDDDNEARALEMARSHASVL